MPSSFHPTKARSRSMPPSGSTMEQARTSSFGLKTKAWGYPSKIYRESSIDSIRKTKLKQAPVWDYPIANSWPKPMGEASWRKTASSEALQCRCFCQWKPGKPSDFMTLRLLIADDERLFRQSLRILLETAEDITVVAEAGDGQEAVVKAKETAPDIALLDVRMPKMDGIKAAKLISTVAPRTKILMLSIHDDDEKIVSAIKAGARGYILKDTDRSDFVQIIRHTYAGKTHSSPYLAHLTVEQSALHHELPKEDRERRFSDKYGVSDLELNLLQLLA